MFNDHQFISHDNNIKCPELCRIMEKSEILDMKEKTSINILFHIKIKINLFYYGIISFCSYAK